MKPFLLPTKDSRKVPPPMKPTEVHIDKAQILIPKRGRGDSAVFNIHYMLADQELMVAQCRISLQYAAELKEHAYTTTERSLPLDEENWVDFDFYVKVEYAFRMLKENGMIEEHMTMCPSSGCQMESFAEEEGRTLVDEDETQ